MHNFKLPDLNQSKVHSAKATSLVTPSSGSSFVSEEYAAVASSNEAAIQPLARRRASPTLPLFRGVLNYKKSSCLEPFASSESLKNLQWKQRMFEQEEERDLLIRQERKQRALLVNSESDEYQQLQYSYGYQLIKLDQKKQILLQTEKRASEEAHRQQILHIQEVEELINEEKQSRAHLERMESESLNFLTSLQELLTLEREAAFLKTKERNAEGLYLKAMHVRNNELRVSQTHYHPPKKFHLLSVSDPFRAVGIYAEERESSHCIQRQEARLMYYKFFEEEFAARQQKWHHYQLSWLSLEYFNGAALIALQEEPLARRGLEKLLGYVACQVRLVAFIRIQRWWRLLQRQLWSAWRREALANDLKKITAHRLRFTLKKETDKLQRKSCDIEADLVSLVKAAESYRYDIMMDHYIYYLGVKMASFLKEQQYEFKIAKLSLSSDSTVPGMDENLLESAAEDYCHVLSQNSLLNLCQTRFTLPYGMWRRTQWVTGTFDK